MGNFVGYKEANLLKSIGFVEKCDAHYESSKIFVVEKSWYNKLRSTPTQWVDAPTWSQVFTWFIKTYKLSSHIDLYSISHLGENYYFQIRNFADSYEGSVEKDYGFSTYEEAQLECLRKLIKYVS